VSHVYKPRILSCADGYESGALRCREKISTAYGEATGTDIRTLVMVRSSVLILLYSSITVAYHQIGSNKQRTHCIRLSPSPYALRLTDPTSLCPWLLLAASWRETHVSSETACVIQQTNPGARDRRTEVINPGESEHAKHNQPCHILLCTLWTKRCSKAYICAWSVCVVIAGECHSGKICRGCLARIGCMVLTIVCDVHEVGRSTDMIHGS